MAQYMTTLKGIVGQVRGLRPSIPNVLVRDFVNQRIRSVIDYRPFWAGMLKNGVLSVPAVYNTGTVSFTAGSVTVTGTSTAWAYNDKVNTTIPAGINETGFQRVVPVSMTGIDDDTILLVDPGTISEEIVQVMSYDALSFRADFVNQHDADCVIQSSSLAGRQVRLSASYPIYTVRAVSSATSLTLDNIWAGVSLAGSAYSIVKSHYTFAPDIKDLLTVYDTVRGYQLDVHYSQEMLNQTDPQRSRTGDPLCVSDLYPGPSGNMQYEIYPIPTTARQLPFLYVRQWPELRKDNDTLPPFINPNVVVWGVYAQALRWRNGKDDYGYDPSSANNYEQLAQMELERAAQADDGKAQQTLTYEMSRYPRRMGGEWAQSHDVSAYGDDGRWF